MNEHKFRVGNRVRYSYHVGAMSACQNGKMATGEGVIDEIREAGSQPWIGVGRHWFFPRELTLLDDKPVESWVLKEFNAGKYD